MKIISYLGHGIAHERSGIPCQDACGSRSAPNGNVVAVLSDGASHAAYAAVAAQETVTAVLDYFTQFSLGGSDFVPQDFVDFCRARLLLKQESLGMPAIQHLSATLVFAVISEKYILIGHLGDGTIIALSPDGDTILHSQPEAHPEIPNGTYFVISPQAPEHLRFYCYDRREQPVDLLLLSSDGPYEMLCNRGNGNPVATARELQHYIRDCGLRTQEDLADVLNQMAEVPVERFDDWSLLIWSNALHPDQSSESPILHSMYQEEMEKYHAGMQKG